MVDGVTIVNFAGLLLPLRRNDRLGRAAARTDAELPPRWPWLAIRGYPVQGLIRGQKAKLAESAKVALRHGYDCPAGWRSVEENAAIVSGITALSKDPFPFPGGKDAFASKLPVEQIYFLPFVTVGVHDDILMLLAHALDLL